MKNSMVFAETFAGNEVDWENAYIVKREGRLSQKYAGETVRRTTEKYPSLSREFEEEVTEFEETNNLYQTLPVVYDDQTNQLLIMDTDVRGYVLWQLDLKNMQAEKIFYFSGDTGCFDILTWLVDKQLVYAAGTEDVASTAEMRDICIFDLKTGKVSKAINVPAKEALQLYDYYLDKPSSKVIIGQYLFDLEARSRSKLEVPNWEDLSPYSYQFVGGKIILADWAVTTQFVVFDVDENQMSEVFTVEKRTEEVDGYGFVDVSPDFKHILIQEYGKKADGSCYVLVDLDQLAEEQRFCTRGMFEQGERKSFMGWVVE